MILFKITNHNNQISNKSQYPKTKYQIATKNSILNLCSLLNIFLPNDSDANMNKTRWVDKNPAGLRYYFINTTFLILIKSSHIISIKYVPFSYAPAFHCVE